MAEPPLLEIREPGRPVRRVVLDRALEVGRECDGVLLADAGVSRRHVKLLPSPLGLSVVDLGSRNGTLLNGVALLNRTNLEPGDVLRLGATELVVVSPVPARVVDPEAKLTMIGALLPQQSMPVPAPPALPPPPVVPSKASTFFRWLFTGADPAPDMPRFRNYMEIPRRAPIWMWHAVRTGSFLLYIALCIGLFVRPAGAQFAFFKVIIPILPILFFVAPGLWRNICPLAAANQAPRWFGFTKAGTTPKWLGRRAYVIAIVLFFGIAGARLAVFNANAKATGVLLSITILNAFIAGVAFKGKSGWCSSICPLLPLQRVYGQTPFVLVGNSHCSTCVACTKNCYDFKPQVAYQADLHDPDPEWSAPRKLFASALPGFVLGFFTLLVHHGSNWHLYGRLALYFGGSIASFFAIQALLPISLALLIALFGAAAINIFYWYGGVIAASSFHTITGVSAPWLRWPIRLVVLVLSLIWISRTYWSERHFEEESAPARPLIEITPVAAKALEDKAAADQIEVRFQPDDKPVGAELGMSLLEIAEREGLPIEAGCRLGVCGADPVAVLAGMECVSEPEEEELNTLRRLGLAPSTRMACCARVQSGSVKVSLTPERGEPGGGVKPTQFDRSITSVVVLGNGIAGVTASDFVRRGHPDCEIHLIGQESHVLYNRMGISRLVYGRSAMTGLYLLAEDWYAENGVTAWLNTIVSSIDVRARHVVLGTGEVINFDRLILAMGSSSTEPPLQGFGKPGSFVLRSAADAMELRSYAQRHACRTAVVAGGGLLGLEAAYAMHELGLHVTVLERGKRLLSKQVDERCSALVQSHFDRLGMQVLYGAETESLGGGERIDSVVLKDGRTIPCDAFLAAIGIRPNAKIAKDAGVAVNRGVLVNDRMETNVPGVFAAGDIAEHDGLVLGLWPIAAKQGEVAAANALGGDERLVAEIPATILKGVGLELTSIGQVVPGEGDEVIVSENARLPSYRRLIVSRGVLTGALVLGHHPDDLAAATAAVKKRVLLDEPTLAQLRAGNWLVLKDSSRRPVGAGAH